MKQKSLKTIWVLILGLTFLLSNLSTGLAANPSNKSISKPPAKTTVKSKKAVKKSTKTVKAKPRSYTSVKKAQLALNKAGYKLKVDGIMGKQTHAALKRYQKVKGLKVTGKLDKGTKSKLGI